MHFYHCKIKQNDCINHAVTGNFSGDNPNEIIVSRGKNLELLCVFKPLNSEIESLYSLLVQDFNAVILSLEKVLGDARDFVAIGSDSGKIMILEFDVEKKCLNPIKEYYIERNRLAVTPRFTPAMYLAVDPGSQAIAISAIEQNLMFIHFSEDSDDSESTLVISKPRFIFSNLVPVFNDSGIPFFACLEAQYEEINSPYPPDEITPPDSSENSPKPPSSPSFDAEKSASSVNDTQMSTSSKDDTKKSIDVIEKSDTKKSIDVIEKSAFSMGETQKPTSSVVDTPKLAFSINEESVSLIDNTEKSKSSVDDIEQFPFSIENVQKSTLSESVSSENGIQEKLINNLEECSLKCPWSEISEEAERNEETVPSERNEKRIPTMVLQIYKWHWQAKEMFEYAYPLAKHANKLISVPPGECHNGGLLICSCNRVDFLEIDTYEFCHSFFPQRKNLAFENDKGMLISGSAIYKENGKLLILLQCEEGDLYSAQIVKDDEKLKINWTYIDTVPVASAICIIEGRFLFLAADFGDHFFYKINSLGSKDELSYINISNVDKLPLYIARQLTNLELVSGIENLTPVINCMALNRVYVKKCSVQVTLASSSEPDEESEENEPEVEILKESPEYLKLVFACGQGSCSTLRTMRHGVEVILEESEKVEIKYPNCMWTYKEEMDCEVASYIVISLLHDKTMVFSVDEQIENVPKDQFEPIDPKIKNDLLLGYVQIDHDSSIQVFACGVRYSFNDDKKIEWPIKCSCYDKEIEENTDHVQLELMCPHIVSQCTIYRRQIALGLTNNKLWYLEIVQSDIENFTFDAKQWDNIHDEIHCMEFLQNGDKANFLIIGFTKSIQIFTIKDEGKCIESFAKYDMLFTPTSLVVCNTVTQDGRLYYITVGSMIGCVQRFIFDYETKELKKSFLFSIPLDQDNKKFKLIKTEIDEREVILAITSTKTWISFNCTNQFEFFPLLYDGQLDYALGFSSPFSPEVNVIAVSGQNLLFLAVKNFCSLVSESRRQLEFTPRQSVINLAHNLIIMCLNDYREPSYKSGDITPQLAMGMALKKTTYKAPDPNSKCLPQIIKKKPPSKFDCKLCIYDPVDDEFVHEEVPIIPRNHVISRMCVVRFCSNPDNLYLLAVVKKGIYQYPKFIPNASNPVPDPVPVMHFKSYLVSYVISEDGTSLSEVSSLETDYEAEAICPFAGRALIGIKNKLLLCCFEDALITEAKLEVPCNISNIYANREVFVVLCENRDVIYGCLIESTDEFGKPELILLNEDNYLKKVTAVCFWDDDIMVAADIFGDLTLVLLPALPDEEKDEMDEDTEPNLDDDDEQEIEEEETGIKAYRFMKKSYVITKVHVGGIVTSLQKTSLLGGSDDVILYSTVSGSVGVVKPFVDGKLDIIYKPLQYLIKSKSPFYNKDSTMCPRNCTEVDEQALFDQSISEAKRGFIPMPSMIMGFGSKMELADTESSESNQSVEEVELNSSDVTPEICQFCKKEIRKPKKSKSKSDKDTMDESGPNIERFFKNPPLALITNLQRRKSHESRGRVEEPPDESDKNIYYFSEKDPSLLVIDAHVFELYNTLSEEDQQYVAKCLEKKPYEICEAVAKLKTKLYFNLIEDT